MTDGGTSIGQPLNDRLRRIATEVHFERETLCYPDRPRDFREVLRRSVQRNPEKTALVYEGERWSYGRLLADAEAFAALIHKEYSVVKGDRVALLTGNVPEFVIAAAGLSLLGAVLVPLNNRLQGEELAYMLADSGSRVLVTTPDQWEKVAPVRDRLPELKGIFMVRGEAAAGTRPWSEAPRGSALPEVSIAEDDPIFLCYTSGTTGRPKGAVLTHFNLVHTLLNYEDVKGLSEADITLLGLPIFHVTGLAAQYAQFLYQGGTIVLAPIPFKAEKALALMEQERVTHFFGVPTIYLMLLNHKAFERYDLSSLRIVASGGAPLPPDVAGRLADRLPHLRFINFYGLTETTSPATCLPDRYKRSHGGSAGLPFGVTELKVVDDAGGEVGRDQVGELAIRGPMIFAGYWGNEQATAKAFLPGGWFLTGDLARIDPDGFLFIMDRKKDMINRGGEKIYCVEVENCLTAHPAVLEAAVVGKRDPFFGETVRAVVVLRLGAEASAEALRQFVAGRLADYKVPAIVEFAEQLPRNPGGKVLKELLRT